MVKYGNKILFLFVVLVYSLNTNICYSSKVRANHDILFFNNDTLLLNKIFSDEIIGKLLENKDFKINNNPKKVNWYTAIWEINDNKLYLLKVTNCISNFCTPKSIHDTLNLSHAFGNRYKDGKVGFNVSNQTLFAHKPYSIRNIWAWGNIYIEDYFFNFKNKNHQLKIDTVFNYINSPECLNRYSWIQLNETFYSILKKTIKINNPLIIEDSLFLTVEAEIDNSGKLILFNAYLTNHLFNLDTIDTSVKDLTNIYFDFKKTKEILTSVCWDELKHTNDDKVSFNFVFYKNNLFL